MKWVQTIFIALLLATTIKHAHADELKCAAILDMQTKIEDIHKFVSKAPVLSDKEYYKELNKLNNETHTISAEVLGCDDYTDNLVEQMHDVVAQLNIHSNRYRGL